MRATSFSWALCLLAAAGASQAATTVLYTQDFENPVGFVNDGGDVNIYRTVNQLYSNQPSGFVFSQAYTVETLLVGGTQAWGKGFQDPQGRAGAHVLSMLSTTQDDKLGLAFDVQSSKYLNFRLDISSIDLDRWGGPFVPTGGMAPTFRFSLFDNPSGQAGLGAGAPLSFVDLSGTVASNRYTFNWTNVVAGLSTAGNTNGRVILRIDLLSGGYAAMDNFVIAASDDFGSVPGVPEAQSGLMLLAGLGVVGAVAARRRRTWA